MSGTIRDEEILEEVKLYYGKTIQNVSNLQTNVCAVRASKSMFAIHQEAIKLVHKNVLARYYGCGHIIPEAISGLSILDLGCGTGTDCFVLSKLVGENGKIVGVDMTEEQLAVGRMYTKYHSDLFGYKKENVSFRKSCIEQLIGEDMRQEEFDIIVSNCVINLTPDKKAVLREAFRVLKFGGELYFSDIYTDRLQSDELRKHKVLWCEGLSGALLWKDFYKYAKEIGFIQPRIVASGELSVDEKFKDVLGKSRFTSTTYRLFKLPLMCTTSGPQTVVYNGGIVGHEKSLILDSENVFKKDVERTVDEETGRVLSCSRFRQYFTFRNATPAELDNCCGPVLEIDPMNVARCEESST